jgi:hypothetical protein
MLPSTGDGSRAAYFPLGSPGLLDTSLGATLDLSPDSPERRIFREVFADFSDGFTDGGTMTGSAGLTGSTGLAGSAAEGSAGGLELTIVRGAEGAGGGGGGSGADPPTFVYDFGWTMPFDVKAAPGGNSWLSAIGVPFSSTSTNMSVMFRKRNTSFGSVTPTGVSPVNV